MPDTRRGGLTLTPTGGSGTPIPFTLLIRQLGTGPSVVVAASGGADFASLPAAGGQITATVSISGGATDWTAMVTTNPDDFLSFPSGSPVHREQHAGYRSILPIQEVSGVVR